MGGAQQEVFNFFFTIHDEVNTPTIWILHFLFFGWFLLINYSLNSSQVDVGKRSVVNHCEESSSIIPLLHSPDHLLFLVAINLSTSS
jgi:hypothetical protein